MAPIMLQHPLWCRAILSFCPSFVTEMESQHEAQTLKSSTQIFSSARRGIGIEEQANALNLGEGVPQFSLGFQGTLSIVENISPMVGAVGSEHQLLFPLWPVESRASPKQAHLPSTPPTQLASSPCPQRSSCPAGCNISSD